MILCLRLKNKIKKILFFICAPCRVRTCDLVLKRDLLYQLS